MNRCSPTSRRTWSAVLAVVLGAVSIVFGTSRPASACSCVHFIEGLDFGDSAAVFVGEVVSERAGAANAFGEQELELVFRVDRLYRGDLTDRALVYSLRDNGANCGLNPQGVMAVRAYVGDDQRLRSDGCSVSQLDDGGEVEAALEERFGPGVLPPPADPDVAIDEGFGDDSGPPWLLIGGGVFLVALAAGSVLILRAEKSAT